MKIPRPLISQALASLPFSFSIILGGALALNLGAIISDASAFETRTIDGTNNNIHNPSWGSTNSQLLRKAAPDYEDGIATPSGHNHPNVREISNSLAAQKELIYNKKKATDMLWQWGQFLDHDMDLTGGDPNEPMPIAIPIGDPHFDPKSTGTQEMPMNRSVYDRTTGLTPENPRQQINQITAFIDASNVYGSDPTRARALRTNDGTGRLKTSKGNLLPFNIDGLPNDGGSSPSLFLAGDIRANEQVGLTSMHTLFVREHNRKARKLHRRLHRLTGDQIYERARAWVGALMQVVTYQEFLPVLLGPNAMRPYTGYDANVNPGISNTFSTAAYRVGHTMLSATLPRLKRNGRSIPEGRLALRDAFFAPWRITNEGGIAPLLRGLTSGDPAQEVDTFIIDDVRNFLFGVPGAGGFDLASMNIQRGRDHGLPSYNTVRLAFGLSPAVTFADLTQDTESQERLQSMYGNLEHVDVWVGGLAEDHRPGAMVGELFFTILVDQFERLRDGDRFFYRNIFRHHQIRNLEKTTLAKIIRRNTRIGRELQKNVFLLSEKHKHVHSHKHHR